MDDSDNMLIFDAHCDTVNALTNDPTYFINKNNSHLSFEKIKKGGLKAQIFAIWVNPAYAQNRQMKKALGLYRVLEKELFNKNLGEKVTSIKEMDSAIANNKLACWIFLEGGHIIGDSIENLEYFYSLGVRGMTLTHTKNTGWADSSNEEPKWDGLNELGRKIVSRMNKLGMAIDISHCSDKTVKDVLEISESPVMASHSCARSLCDIPRNLSDDLISEIASNNGYIGVNFFPRFLSQKVYDQTLANLKKYENWYKEETNKNKDDPDMLNRLELELYDKMLEGTNKVDMSVLIDHISHIIDIGGIDCVGLGSDFDGINTTPIDLTDVSCYPALINELYNRGFHKNEVRKIMGINLYKFLKKI